MLAAISSISYFNPRSREGSDLPMAMLASVLGISIHAPAKGATNTATHIEMASWISIHAPAKGATIISLPSDPGYYISIHAPAKGATFLISFSGEALKFQSTLPRRERLTFIISAHLSSDFNPRSREGSDSHCFLVRPAGTISIHAPAKGATVIFAMASRYSAFQSTLPRRERQPCH